MNELLLRKYIKKQLKSSNLNEFFIMAMTGIAAVKWLSSDDEDAVSDALVEVSEAAVELQDAVEDMVGNIEYEAISAVITEQGSSAVETIQAAINDARATVSDAVKSAIEGDEELLNEVPLGEADQMANIAILAAIANVVSSLTAEE
tara:strand:+ start:17927 stop:18367 length:441 start_codon:yes stop_codon:yes gene_type:complete